MPAAPRGGGYRMIKLKAVETAKLEHSHLLLSPCFNFHVTFAILEHFRALRRPARDRKRAAQHQVNVCSWLVALDRALLAQSASKQPRTSNPRFRVWR